MYSVTIREHVMIAHSLPDDFFGPAKRLHGATYVVDVTFSSEHLNEYSVVVDIGYAHQVTKEVLGEIEYRNLDDMEVFEGKLTTTEFLAKHIHDNILIKSKTVFKGTLKVTLGESHIACASYQGT